MILLKISGLSKLTFYYTLAKIDKDIKNNKIKTIYLKQYGYSRITLELKIKSIMLIIRNFIE